MQIPTDSLGQPVFFSLVFAPFPMKMVRRCLAVLAFSALVSSSFAVIKLLGTPVVFTNNNGGGSGEVQAPADVEAVAHLEAGGTVSAAWWTPLDNISNLGAIHHIETRPKGNGVDLVVKGLPGHGDARVRISVYAEVR